LKVKKYKNRNKVINNDLSDKKLNLHQFWMIFTIDS
jgi:hypothetical protein